MKRFFLIIYLLVFINACGDPPPLKLTSAQRDQVDTLYNQQVVFLAEEMDSLCDLSFERDMQNVIDSIYKVRKKAEKALREKYQSKWEEAIFWSQ